MGLNEDIKKLAEQIEKRKTHIKGEESTKQALVLPFLQVLGFDIYDPTEVKPEYVADFAKKKSSGQFEKIDYCLFIKNQPSIFVECKAIGEPLSIDDGQLARYFNSTPSVKLAVLTNGLEYQLFTDSIPNIMDGVAFCKFNLLSTLDVEDVKLLSKANFSLANIKLRAETSASLDKIFTFLQGMVENPTENFIRFILTEGEITNSRLTTALISRYTSTVKAALDKLTRKDGITETNAVTTAEELEIFKTVKEICEKVSRSPIKYKDTIRFFSIEAESKWFLRLFAGERRRCFISRLSVKEAQKLAPGAQIEECAKTLGESRLYFNSVVDLEKLSNFIIGAYQSVLEDYDEFVIEEA